MVSKGLNWETRGFFEGLAKFVVMTNFAVNEAMTHVARDIQDFMQENAPWEDQTGNARRGLRAENISRGFRQEIDLYDVEDYEFWLEIRWDGQYAIIIPTLEQAGGFLAPHLTGLLSKTEFTKGVGNASLAAPVLDSG